MVLVAEEKDQFLELQVQYERQPQNQPETWVKDLRQASVARFDHVSFPGPKSEDWKFTSVASLLQVPFSLPEKAPIPADLRDRLDAETLPGAIRLVFINGHWSPELSNLARKPEGLVAGNLRAIIDHDPKRVKPYLGQFADFHEQVFTALNTAFLGDGAAILIAKGMVVAEPIQLFFVSVPGSRATLTCPRVLIVAGTNSQATVLEKYMSVSAEDVNFTNAVTEIALEGNAVLDHCKLQEESAAACHVANTQIRMDRTSTLHSTYVSLGGRLVRNESRVLFAGEGSEATLDGLYLAGGRQHVDNFTVIDHAKPRCTSHELYKGILRDRAHGVFNGKIFVRQDAQKTDAKQTNKVLLLSEEATINTKPQLEIFADDVKCTHGATVGQLDDEGIFYLRSRGIGLDEARNLLVHAFANDIIGRIRASGIRRLVEQHVIGQHLTHGQSVPEDL